MQTTKGGALSGNVLRFNFVGSGVTATNSGGNITVTVPGGAGLTSLTGNAMTAGSILIGNASNLSSIQSLSGDAALSSTGVFTITGDAVALGTDTTGNYTSGVTGGTGIVVTGTAGEGWTPTIALDINGLTSDGIANNADQIALYDADTGSVRKIARSTLLSGVTGALLYQGTWNANTNVPALSTGSGTQGQYYVVSAAGTQNIGAGSSALTFAIGDWIVRNSSNWEKLTNSVTIASVFGRTGTVTAQSGDYTATQITNTGAGNISSTNVQSALNELDTEKLPTILTSGMLFVGSGSGVATGVALSGDATLSNAGVLTIANNAITTSKILDGTIALADLASDSVDSSKIVNGSIATADIASNSVDGSKLALGSDVAGDLMYYNGTDYVRLAIGTVGQFLQTNGGATAPTWVTGSAVNLYNTNGTLSAARTITSGGFGLTYDGTGDIVFNDAGLISSVGLTSSGAVTITPFSTAGLVHNNASGVLSSSLVVDADVSASAAITLSKLAGGANIVTSLATPSGSNANGGSISANVLTLSLADGTNPGLVSTGTQTFAGAKTFSSTIVGSISGNASTVTTNANLTGDVTSVGNATTLTNAPVIAKVLTGYVSGAGTVATTDSILGAIQKLNGNTALVSGAVTSLTAPSGTNANGGSIASNILTLSLADGTNPGLVSTGTQTFAGAKTFLGATTFTGNISQTGANTFSTGSGANTLNGNVTISGSNTLTTGTGLTTISGNNSTTGNTTLTGYLAMKAGTTYTTPGSANDVALGNASLIRLDTSAGAQTLTGIVAGADGQVLTLMNTDAALSVALGNNDSSSVAGNRIITGTGSSMSISAGASIQMVYDKTGTAATSFWRVVGGSGGGSSSASSVTLGDFATGGSVGTAVATVDTYTNLNIAQTTTLQTLTLPTPTVTTAGKMITVNNTGTANFTMYGSQVSAGSNTTAFVWNGTAWNALNAASNVSAEYGENNGITNAQTVSTTLVDVAGSSFTLPSAGTWEVTYNIFANNAGAAQTTIRVYDSSNVMVPNSQASAQHQASGGPLPVSNTARITTTGAATYKLRGVTDANTSTIFNNDNTVQGGRSKITWRKISGFMPSSGQTVDYVTGRITTSQNTDIADAVDHVKFDTVFNGGIPLDTTTTYTSTNGVASRGRFTLTAGKTYDLLATIGELAIPTTSLNVRFQWYDVTTGTAVALGQSTVLMSPSYTGTAIQANPHAHAVFTPSVNSLVEVRIVNGSGLTIVVGGANYSSTFFIKQIGSTAVTGVSMNSLTAAIAAGALDNTNFAQTWNWSTLSAGTSGLVLANTVSGTTQNNTLTISGGNNTGVNSSNLIKFTRPDGTTIGSVAQNAAGTVAYNTTSDVRLKENIVNSLKGLDAVMAIQVKDYSYINDETHTTFQGLLAQDLFDVYGQAVTVGTDEVDQNGHLVNPWAIDYGKLTPLLVKGIQDVNFKVEGGFSVMSVTELSTFANEGAIVSYTDAVKAEIPRNAAAYLAEKMTAGFKPVEEFFATRITAIRGYFDQVFTKKLCLVKDDGSQVCLDTNNLTKKLCLVKDDGSQVCLDANDLETIKAGHSGQSTNINVGTTVSSSTGDGSGGGGNVPPTCTLPQVLNSTATACTDPVPTSSTDPAPAPESEPTSSTPEITPSLDPVSDPDPVPVVEVDPVPTSSTDPAPAPEPVPEPTSTPTPAPEIIPTTVPVSEPVPTP